MTGVTGEIEQLNVLLKLKGEVSVKLAPCIHSVFNPHVSFGCSENGCTLITHPTDLSWPLVNLKPWQNGGNNETLSDAESASSADESDDFELGNRHMLTSFEYNLNVPARFDHNPNQSPLFDEAGDRRVIHPIGKCMYTCIRFNPFKTDDGIIRPEIGRALQLPIVVPATLNTIGVYDATAFRADPQFDYASLFREEVVPRQDDHKVQVSSV